MMTWFAIKAINFYQKFISPYKGFSCAHRVATGESSCSAYGKKVIGRFGLFTGMKLLNRRFFDCSWNAQELKKIREAQEKANNTYKIYRPIRGRRLAQGGFVDADCSGCDGLDCSGCDMPHCDMPSCELPHCDMPDLGACLPNTSDCTSGANFCFWADCGAPSNVDCCGISNRNQSPQFKEKRDNRNKNKYGTINPENNFTANATKKPVSLKKDEDIGEVDSPE